VALAGGLVLASCGKVETLDQPAPLWGAKAKADYQARKAAEAARSCPEQAISVIP